MPADPRVDAAVGTCRHQWSRMGLSDARISDMTRELGAHLCDALADGRTIDSVTGADLAAFAQEWARENAPVGLQRWWVERRKRVPVYVLVVVVHQCSMWATIPGRDDVGAPTQVIVAISTLVLVMEVRGLLLVWRARAAGAVALVVAGWLGLFHTQPPFATLGIVAIGCVEIWRSLVEQSDNERDEPRCGREVRWWHLDDSRSLLGRLWFARGAWESCMGNRYLWSPSVRSEGVRVAHAVLARPRRAALADNIVDWGMWLAVVIPFHVGLASLTPGGLLVLLAVFLASILVFQVPTTRVLVRRARRVIEWHDPDFAATRPWQAPGVA